MTKLQLERENQELQEDIQRLKKKIVRLENKLFQYTQNAHIHAYIDKIHLEISSILEYCKDFEQLKKVLKSILQYKYKLKIDFDKKMDDAVIDALSFIRSIKKFNNINHEIVQLVHYVRRDFHEASNELDEYMNSFHTMCLRTGSESYSNSAIELLNQNAKLRQKLAEIDMLIEKSRLDHKWKCDLTRELHRNNSVFIQSPLYRDKFGPFYSHIFYKPDPNYENLI